MARPKFENREKVKYPIRFFFELETIKKLGVKKIREISRKAVEDCELIPLTEELLLKFGFYKVKNSSLRYSYRDDNWLFNNFWINQDFFPCIENYGDDCMNIIGLKLHYVHELQNLYFALIGEELVFSDAIS
jgi:hypothetical protein